MKLKSVLLGLLFSFLLIPSFSNALTLKNSWNTWENSAWDSNLQFVVSPYGGSASRRIGYNPKSPLLYVSENSNFNAFMFWDENQFPYMYIKIGPGSYQSSSIYSEGEITKYSICDEITADTSASSFPSGCQSYNTNTGSVEVFSNFNTNTTTDDYVFINLVRSFSSAEAYGTFTYCISNHSLGKSICYFASTCALHYYYGHCPDVGMGLNSLYNFNWGPAFDTLPESLFNFPPSAGDTITDPNVSDQHKKGDVFNAYAERGYYKGLCYSDFSLNNIMNMSGSADQIYETELEDSEYYTGATVFDLYNAYSSSGSLDFTSFWNRSLNYFNVLYNRNIIPNYFEGRSKGLAYLDYKLFIHKDQITDFNFTDYYNFCTFALNYDPSQHDEKFSEDDINGGTLPGSVQDQLEEEEKVRLCNENPGSAFCGGFTAGGGGGGGGSRPASITDFYNKGFGILEALKGITGPANGILPGYIIIGFLGFVLLYMLKR